jgi:predicted Zn-dependent protease
LIAWSDEHSYKPLAGDVAGIGQSVAAKARSGRLAYVSGQVVLDDGQLSAARVTDRADVRAVLLHELGHLVGLDHTSDRRQLMFSESQFNVTDYANGDLRGLALLGTQSCFRDL